MMLGITFDLVGYYFITSPPTITFGTACPMYCTCGSEEEFTPRRMRVSIDQKKGNKNKNLLWANYRWGLASI